MDELTLMIKKVIKSLTPKQRAAFDSICIDQDGGHHPKTLQSLVKKGLVRKYEEQQGFCTIFRYDVANMKTHIAWCDVCSEENPEEL